MIRRDFRNTEYCIKLKRIKRKKIKLTEKIKKNHPRNEIEYNAITKHYREEFNKIYNYKCSYCGASYEIIGIDRLEIDHFIHESSFGQNKALGGKIENLVLACYGCNRKKSSYLIDAGSEKMFNPDSQMLKKIFYRALDYGIKIRYKYKNNSKVQEFYEKLSLDSEFRKLDYLILRIKKCISKTKDDKEKSKLIDVYLKLQEKRNKINPLSSK